MTRTRTSCGPRSPTPGGHERRAAAFLGVREVFGDELAESGVFRALVADGMAQLDGGRQRT